MASLAGGLSLNALKAGPSDRLKGGPPTRASGPSFMAMLPPDTESVAPCSHGCLGDSQGTLRGVVGRGAGEGPQEGGSQAVRRTQKLLGTSGWCLEAVRDASLVG